MRLDHGFVEREIVGAGQAWLTAIIVLFAILVALLVYSDRGPK